MNRLSGLDGVRACASLMIVWHHLSQTLHVHAEGLWETMQMICWCTIPSGVTVFFVLSGALLSRKYWKNYFEGKELPSLKDFFVRRMARIAPAFYVAMFVALGLEAAFLPDVPDRLWRLLTGLTFTTGWNYHTFFITQVNGPLWSIGFEVTSYILLALSMPLLFLFFRARSFQGAFLWWAAALAVTFALNGWIQTAFQPDDVERGWQYGIVGGAKYWMPHYNPIGFFAQYLLGVGAAGVTVWLQQHGEIVERFQKYALFDVLALIGIAGYAVMLVVFAKLPEFSWSFQTQPYHFPIFTGLAALAVAALPLSKLVGRILDNRFFSYTAKISFGLYIYHYIFIAVVFYSGPVPGTESVTDWLLGCAGILAATYAVATLSWFKMEKPIIDWAKRRFLEEKVCLAAKLN